MQKGKNTNRENTDPEILIGRIQFGKCESENTNQKIQLGKYKSESTNRKIQVENYKSENTTRKYQLERKTEICESRNTNRNTIVWKICNGK